MKTKTKAQQFKKLLKKMAVITLVVVCGILLVVGVSDGIFRTKVGIKNFDKELSSVSPATRRALKDKINEISLLNSGKMNYDADFLIREASVETTDNDETKEKYAKFFVDSEKLHISLRVQLNWAPGLTETKEAYDVFIECADEPNWQFSTNYCIAPQEETSFRELKSENLRLLDEYSGLENSDIRMALVNYIASVEPNVESLLVQRESLSTGDGELEADILAGTKNKYHLKLKTPDEVILFKNDVEIWQYNAKNYDDSKHSALVTGNYLPVELSTENGTDFALRWAGANKLKISSDVCADGDSDEVLIKQAKAWLDETGFAPEDFEISMQKSCIK